MQIAVTGGTGFLGRYLLHELAGAGHQLRCWHRSTSDRSGLDYLASSIEWQQGDLADAAATQKLVSGVDAVVHSALDWERTKNRFPEIDVIQKNLIGSLLLFQEAHKAGVERFIFISTCAVHEIILEDRSLDETHPTWPTNHYGAHKAALEKFVHSYGFGKQWSICALRPTGIYGVAHPITSSRWYDLVGQVVRGEPVNSDKGGKEVHASDVALATSLLLEQDPQFLAGQVFNCYDMYIAEQDVAWIAKEISGSSSEIADLNRGPKHQIETGVIRSLGMKFGGDELLEETVEKLVGAHKNQES